MTLEEAIKVVNERGITPWMAYGVRKWNEGYVIVSGSQMKQHPEMDLEYIRKGEGFPGSPVMDFIPLKNFKV